MTRDHAKFLNRIKWRLRHTLLPKGRRRAEVEKLSDLGQVTVAGLFRTGSGIGQAARNCFEALQALGVDVQAVDLSSVYNQTDTQRDNVTSPEAARPWDVLIIFLNAPEFERALFEMRRGWRRQKNRKPRIIGAWAWETTRVPDHWQSAIAYVSEIWVPSEFVKDAMTASFDCPVKVVPHYIPSGEQSAFVPQTAEREKPFQCLVMGDGRSSFERKNILGAVRAFKAAFSSTSNCALIVKTRNVLEHQGFLDQMEGAMGADSRITHLDGTMEAEQVKALVRESDVLISLHRSEGFGLHLAEAMSLGTPVIATGWSGNMEFMTSDNAFLVDYALEQINDPSSIYEAGDAAVWAKPIERQASGYLRAIKEKKVDVNAKVERAKSDVLARLTIDNYRDALLA